jgi:hypothetical protein
MVCGGVLVNGRDEGERTGFMDFIYIKEAEQ